MTLALVDELEQLASAASHAERAAWLLTVPLSTLVKYQMTIRQRLNSAGFARGVEYLDMTLQMYRAPRHFGEVMPPADYPDVYGRLVELTGVEPVSLDDH